MDRLRTKHYPLMAAAAVLAMVEETVVRREERQLNAIGRAQLVENPREVAFDRVFGDREGLRDLPVGGTGDDRFDNVQLASGQPEGFAAPSSLLEFAHACRGIGHTVGVNPVVAGHHAVDGS